MSKHLEDAKRELAGRSTAKISIRTGTNDTHRVVDKTDYEGSDAESEALSVSPKQSGNPRVAPPRGYGGNGAGLGPVRFGVFGEAGVDGDGFSDDENRLTQKSDLQKRTHRAKKPTPLSHEAETSHHRRMLGEPPNWHNPRALVPFREAKIRVPLERASRKAKALQLAHQKGWVPTKAPEYNNPNRTGKAVKVPKDPVDAHAPGKPTVAFELEFEQFKMQKLREKAAGVGDANAERFKRGDYAGGLSSDDESALRDAGVFGAEEQEEESEGELTRDELLRETNASHVPGATSQLLERHEKIRFEFGRNTSPSEKGSGPGEKNFAEVRSELGGDVRGNPFGELNATETEMARVFAEPRDDGGAFDKDGHDAESVEPVPSVTHALRFHPPSEPEPKRNLPLWPTPFGRPKNDVPQRTVRADVGVSYPVPPPEERNLPKYSDRNEGRKKGLAALAFARSVGTGQVGASSFAGAGFGGHVPDPRFMRMNEGVETLGLGPLPPGFLASKEIQQLATALTNRGEYEGGGGAYDREIMSGNRQRNDEFFRTRVSASKRAVTGNVRDGLAGVAPMGGSYVDLEMEGSEGEEGLVSSHENGTPSTRPPVTSGSQTMSLNAHAADAGRHNGGTSDEKQSFF
jgi:hypothetical protein